MAATDPWLKATKQKGRFVSAFSSESIITGTQARNSSRNLEAGLLALQTALPSFKALKALSS